MRIWSVHPKYLDSKGLVALWRETLLAKHVLLGQTKGYKNHPQLIRFKNEEKPVDLINQYLSEIFNESKKRGYNFDKNKIDWNFTPTSILVTRGQLDYEVQHLVKKLESRDPIRFNELSKLRDWKSHPLFKVIPGEIADWEILA